MSVRLLPLAALALALLLSTPAPSAQTTAAPITISYQGMLTDAAGVPVADGSYSVSLALHETATSGSATYAETHPVTTAGGVFAVEIGAGTPTTGTWATVAFDRSWWLATTVDGTTLAPRTRLLAAPYARSFTPGARATGEVATLSGAVLRLENTATSASNYGLLSINASSSGRGVFGTATAATGTTIGVWGKTASPNGYGVFGEGVGLGVYGTSTAVDGTGVYGYSTGGIIDVNFGVHGRSDSRSGRGVYGEVRSTIGTTTGVFGEVASSSGRGVYGIATATTGTAFGVHGESSSASGMGVRGNAAATTGTTYGVWGRSASTSGTGVYGTVSATSGSTEGVYGSVPSTSGIGVRGHATATSGTTYGGYFRTYSSAGRGVYGWASAASGSTFGGYFQAASPNGTAVYGTATSTSGSPYGVTGQSAGASGRGVFGSSSGATGIGVQGVASASSGVNYGGYFQAASTSGRGLVGSADAASGTTYGGYFFSASPAGYGLYAINGAGGLAMRVAGTSRFDNDMDFYDGASRRVIIDVDEGGDAPAIKLLRGGVTVLELDADHNGDSRVITQELEITGGSDLAEAFDVAPTADTGPAPGLVVSIDPAHPGRLAVSATPYDRLVAGVMSGAGGVEAGMIMGQRGSVADGEHPVALVGRVYVWTDATQGAVRPGDFLTTSATPGHAMRADDAERRQGAVIGKAMTALESGRGLVLVLVSLQ